MWEDCNIILAGLAVLLLLIFAIWFFIWLTGNMDGIVKPENLRRSIFKGSLTLIMVPSLIIALTGNIIGLVILLVVSTARFALNNINY